MKNYFEFLEEMQEQQKALYSPTVLQLINESKQWQDMMGPLSAIKMAVESANASTLALKHLDVIDSISNAFQVRNGLMSPMEGIFEMINRNKDLFPHLTFVQHYQEITSGLIPWSQSVGLGREGSRPEFIQIVPMESDDSVEIEVNMDKRIQLVVEGEMKVYVNEIGKIQSIIKGLKDKKLNLKGISPTDFEDLISELMRKRGFDVKQSKRTRDGGYDILAFVQGKDDSPLKYLVQCKHPKFSQKKIDVRVIREFKTVINENSANKGLIFTSTDFSSEGCQSWICPVIVWVSILAVL